MKITLTNKQIQFMLDKHNELPPTELNAPYPIDCPDDVEYYYNGIRDCPDDVEYYYNDVRVTREQLIDGNPMVKAIIERGDA